jgi:hypothetical protein
VGTVPPTRAEPPDDGVSTSTTLLAAAVYVIVIAPVVPLVATEVTLGVAVGAVQPDDRSACPAAAFSETVVFAEAAIAKPSDTRDRTK